MDLQKKKKQTAEQKDGTTVDSLIGIGIGSFLFQVGALLHLNSLYSIKYAINLPHKSIEMTDMTTDWDETQILELLQE